MPRLIDPSTEPMARPSMCLPRRRAFGLGPFPTLAATDKIRRLPRADWTDTDLSHEIRRVLDQNGVLCCTAAAAVGALQLIRTADGLADRHLSMGVLYGQINGGVDAGAAIDDALEALQTTGTCSVQHAPELEWRQGYWPANWRALAANFRIAEAFDAETLDDVGSGLELHYPTVAGIFWGSAGHAVIVIGKRRVQTRWEWLLLNSWGAHWEDDGRAYVSEQAMAGIRTFGAWILRCAHIAGDDPPLPRPTAEETPLLANA